MDEVLPHGLPSEMQDMFKTDKIVVEQKATFNEACCGYEGENRFDITDRFGAIILKALEQSNCCARQCCGKTRPFDMEIKDVRVSYA